MDDFEVDDIINQTKRRKLNSGRKGKNVERNLCKLLNERFGGGFSRSVGSGNRWSQVANMPKHAKDVFSGDLVVPPGFFFSIESKGGYEDIDLNSALDGGSAELDAFLKQATHDSEQCGRKPMLVWKKNHKPWLAFLRTADLSHQNWEYRLIYREWSAVTLKDLLSLEDSFFLGGGEK